MGELLDVLGIAVSKDVFGAHGQIRVVLFDGDTVLAKVGFPGDPVANRFTYPGPNFRYRSELCVNGSFVPITAPITAGRASFNQGGEFWTETYGSELTAPTAGNILFGLTWSWGTRFVTLHIEAKHKCESIIVAEVATNYATASVTIPGHEDDAAKLVDTIGVTIHYDGTPVASGPGIESESGEGEGLPGTVQDADGAGGGLSGFPYGAPISKTLTSAKSVEVSDQIRGALMNVCNGFTATGVVKMTDGRTLGVTAHSR